jgi:hypothetical protein
MNSTRSTNKCIHAYVLLSGELSECPQPVCGMLGRETHERLTIVVVILKV